MKAGLIVGSTALFLVLILFPSDTQAHHRIFLLDSPQYNPYPGGSTSNFGILWGGWVPWVGLDQQVGQVGICNDWNYYDYNAMPQGIRDAVASWEAVFGGSQFSTGCGSTGYGLNFYRSTGCAFGSGCPGHSPSMVDQCGGNTTFYYGCAQIANITPSNSWPSYYDSTRKAYYVDSMNVW